MINPFKNKKGLGRGLSSLIGDSDLKKTSDKISISSIVPNKNQPRKLFEKDTLEELKIILPKSSPPAGAYAKAVILDGYAHLSGQGPRDNDGKPLTGQVPTDLSVDEAILAARNVGLYTLVALQDAIGSLDRVEQVVRTFGMVNAAPGFTEHPRVIDGFSNLFIDIFGEKGRGARSAVGMSSLPFNIPVEVEITIKILAE